MKRINPSPIRSTRGGPQDCSYINFIFCLAADVKVFVCWYVKLFVCWEVKVFVCWDVKVFVCWEGAFDGKRGNILPQSQPLRTSFTLWEVSQVVLTFRWKWKPTISQMIDTDRVGWSFLFPAISPFLHQTQQNDLISPQLWIYFTLPLFLSSGGLWIWDCGIFRAPTIPLHASWNILHPSCRMKNS